MIQVGKNSPLRTFALAGTTALAFPLASFASSIVYSGPQNLTITADGTTPTAALTVQLDGVTDAFTATVTFSTGFPLPTFALIAPATGFELAQSTVFDVTDNPVSLATAFLGGDLIDANGMSATSANLVRIKFDSFGAWLDNNPHYFGLRFDNGSGLQYAWVQAQVNYLTGTPEVQTPGLGAASVPSISLTVIDWAYDSSGAPIVAGDAGVPEPGTMALFAIGAAGLVALRRRRKA